MFLTQIAFQGEVLLPAPSWVSYAPQSSLSRNRVHWITTTSENNWFPKAEEIEKIILKNKDKNYLLFLNSPNNPSGTIHGKLEELAKVAKHYNIIILSDEIYAELDFSGKYKSISHYYPDGTIVSSGLSKWCGAGGWRLGTIIFPNKLTYIKDAIRVIASETYTAVSAPIQYAAIKAYTHNHENLKIYDVFF